MALTVNTNVTSMSIQTKLNRTSDALSTSMNDRTGLAWRIGWK